MGSLRDVTSVTALTTAKSNCHFLTFFAILKYTKVETRNHFKNGALPKSLMSREINTCLL